MSKPDPKTFSDRAELPRVGILRELVDLLIENRKWWLAPVILSLALVGVLVLLSSSAAAPFIYTLF